MPTSPDVRGPLGRRGSPSDDIGTSDFVHTEVSGSAAREEEEALGHVGRAFNRRSPFFLGFMGALGVLAAYVLVRLLADLGTVMQLIGLSLFIAIGLDPAVVWLSERRRLPRWAAVVIVVLVALAFIGAFVAAAVGPISREIHLLQVKAPMWRAQAESGRGWLGHLTKEFHLQSQLRSGSLTKKINPQTVAGGVVGAGKIVLTAVSAVVVVIVLTLYFLIALPAVRDLYLHLVPRSRRTRVAALSDEVLSRVGGFVLGNLLTSIVAGIGTWVWLVIFGVPYPLLLSLLVAILDLIPMVGSTIAGVIVSLAALTVSLPVAIATLAFYIAYRFFEDYLLTPRVMRHTVRISPGITIVAVLAGGVLLGLLGALIAIPLAAGIQLVLEEVTFPALDRR
jgi:predicted PurR-regulated permease PerM